jgi:hypothetical protein
MKWNKASKNKLYQVLSQKAKELELKVPSVGGWCGNIPVKIRDRAAVAEEWEKFLDSFGILQDFVGSIVEQGKYVLISDPGPSCRRVLQIPKDIAEKFLVLGVP